MDGEEGRRDVRAMTVTARQLRREATDAERKLWRILRDRQLAGFKFRRQVPVAGYVLDFYCMKAGLVVEADGGQHHDPGTARRDEMRSARLAQLGIRVIRFPDDVVLKFPEAVAEAIYVALTGDVQGPSPLPSPGVPGEGGTCSRMPRPSELRAGFSLSRYSGRGRG